MDDFFTSQVADVDEAVARLDAASDVAAFSTALAALVEGASSRVTLPVQVDGDELVVRAEGGTYRLTVRREADKRGGEPCDHLVDYRLLASRSVAGFVPMKPTSIHAKTVASDVESACSWTATLATIGGRSSRIPAGHCLARTVIVPSAHPPSTATLSPRRTWRASGVSIGGPSNQRRKHVAPFVGACPCGRRCVRRRGGRRRLRDGRVASQSCFGCVEREAEDVWSGARPPASPRVRAPARPQTSICRTRCRCGSGRSLSGWTGRSRPTSRAPVSV